MEDVQIAGIASGIGLVLVLTELTKLTGLPKRFWPLVAVGWGIVLSVADALTLGAIGARQIWVAGIVGITVGAAAMGLWSGSKNVVRST